MNELSYSQKKYLFAIYKLCESGYIKKEHYGQINLTESWIKTANSIYTSCVIIKEFLENTLGLEAETSGKDREK